MNQNLEKKEMKDFVVQYFIRVCKNHRIYSKFRTSFEKVKRSRDGNPFGPFTNIFDFKDCLEQFTEKEYNHHRRTDDKYEKVTMMINHMIHFFLEKGGADPKRLGMIGQEIFDLACYGIYGAEFLEDMNNMQQEQPKLKNEKEMWLFARYMDAYQKGMTTMSWEDFKNEFLPKIEHMFSNNDDNSNPRRRSRRNREEYIEWNDACMEDEEEF
jgi:hypothetical protein